MSGLETIQDEFPTKFPNGSFFVFGLVSLPQEYLVPKLYTRDTVRSSLLTPLILSTEHTLDGRESRKTGPGTGTRSVVRPHVSTGVLRLEMGIQPLAVRSVVTTEGNGWSCVVCLHQWKGCVWGRVPGPLVGETPVVPLPPRVLDRTSEWKRDDDPLVTSADSFPDRIDWYPSSHPSTTSGFCSSFSAAVPSLTFVLLSLSKVTSVIFV